MRLIRKLTYVSTGGMIDIRSDAQRIASYSKRQLGFPTTVGGPPIALLTAPTDTPHPNRTTGGLSGLVTRRFASRDPHGPDAARIGAHLAVQADSKPHVTELDSISRTRRLTKSIATART
jgi:hypothetical protein